MIKHLNSVSGLLIAFPTLSTESFRQESNYFKAFYVSSLKNLSLYCKPEHISRLFARRGDVWKTQGQGLDVPEDKSSLQSHCIALWWQPATLEQAKGWEHGAGSGDTPP